MSNPDQDIAAQPKALATAPARTRHGLPSRPRRTVPDGQRLAAPKTGEAPAPTPPSEAAEAAAFADLSRPQLIHELVGLRRALESRAVIDQAKGIVMARCACSPDEAFEILTAQSQRENRKVRHIAAEVVQRPQRRGKGPQATS